MIAALGDKTLRNSIDIYIHAGRDTCINNTMCICTHPI